MQQKLDAFAELLTVMNTLRQQCPWDQKQTLETLQPMTLEETYELTQAINQKDMQAIKEELGDLLLHIVFYAKIGEEQQQFDIQSIITSLIEKLKNRHPHIYGKGITLNTEEEVKKNWEKLKIKEGKKSVLEGVPKAMPALPKAVIIQEKAKKVGFEWDNKEQTWLKVEEELQELQQAVKSNNPDEMHKEFGDVLFSLINYARFININPENALEYTNQKFIKRFEAMEKLALHKQLNFLSLSLTEMDSLWNEVKKEIR